MELDGTQVGIAESPGRARSINGVPPYYFGGIDTSAKLPDNALKNLDVSMSKVEWCCLPRCRCKWFHKFSRVLKGGDVTTFLVQM